MKHVPLRVPQIAPQGVLLDISGVLMAGETALPGAVQAAHRLSAAGLPYRFLTDTTSRPRREVLAALVSAGFPAKEHHLLTPAAAARDWLQRHCFAPYLLTADDLAEDFSGLDPHWPPAVVIADAGPTFTYDRLNRAFRLLLEGAPLLALASNRRVTDDAGRPTLDAGAFVAALSFASGAQPILFGKPADSFFAAAGDGLGADPATLAMIGDDAETDIDGALQAGIGHAILVRSGKYRPGDETAFARAPSAVASDIGAAVEMLLADH